MTTSTITPTVTELLVNEDARRACRRLAIAGKQYGAKAEQFAPRSVVRAAVALLKARLQRRADRLAGEAARNVVTGRMAGKLVAIRTARREAARQQIAAKFPTGNYRQSSSSWAGGEHEDRISVGSPNCSGRSERAWSRNGKWSGNNSISIWVVPETWIADVYDRKLACVDGLTTLSATPIRGHGPELYQAVWAEQGKGFAINPVHGYIARVGETTYHAKTARAALDGVQRKAGLKPARRQGTIDLDRLVRRHGGLTVTIVDSREAGNCDSGTVSWCNAVGIDPHGTATIAEVVAGYKLRPLPEVIAVLRRVVRLNRPLDLATPASKLEGEGRVVFNSEGGFRIEPSAN